MRHEWPIVEDDAVTEALRTALARLLKDGWCQGVDKDGCRVCAGQALWDAEPTLYAKACERLLSGQHALSISEWNDSHTFEQVCAAFRKAIG